MSLEYILNPTEDPDLPSHQDSLCAALGDQRIEDICAKCVKPPVFVMASTVDKSLKQYRSDVFYRETFHELTPDETGVVDPADLAASPYAPYCDGDVIGYYTQDGYPTMLQTDLAEHGTPRDKILSEVVLDFSSTPETDPSRLHCDSAASPSPDPGCAIWKEATPKGGYEAGCLSHRDDDGHESNTSRRGKQPKFQMYRRGKWLAYRISVRQGDKAENTGGDISFTSIEPRIRRADAGR